MDNAIEVTRKNEFVPMQKSRKTFMPLANVYETPSSYIIIADVPGVDDKSLEIQLEKNELKIHGKVIAALGSERVELVHAEYQEGDYERTFTINESIDAGKIEATLKNGVLRVNLPKAESAKPRKITVSTE